MKQLQTSIVETKGKYPIHVSDQRTFKQCRRKWNWTSPLREYLESEKPYWPFFTGRAWHYALEMYYEDGRDPRTHLYNWLQAEVKELGDMWPSEQEELAGQIKLLDGILAHYMLWVKGARHSKMKYGDHNLEFISLETEFQTPLRTPITNRVSPKVFLEGRFDGLVRHKPTNELWIWEMKTTRSIPEFEQTLANDDQAGIYILAAQEIVGEPIAGVLYNLGRKKVPPQVKKLKSGYMSQNKSSDITIEWWWDCVLSDPDHQKPDDMTAEDYVHAIEQQYLPYIEHLEGAGNSYFARVPVRRTQHELEQLAKDTHLVALEMTREDVPIYPTPNWMNCKFCHFRTPCLTQNQGGDVEEVLKHMYRPRRKWDAITGKEE